MEDFFARAVFFVRDAERSLAFYTGTLGFSLEWNHQVDSRAFVFEVSFHGFSLILNQVVVETEPRAGLGRVFLGLEDDQIAVFRQHLADRGIETTTTDWGGPTLVVKDPDGNEIFCWLPRSEWDT